MALKRIAAMVVLLALLACQGALAQNYIVQYPGTEHHHNRHALLLTEAGKLLCDPSEYSEIQRLTPRDVRDNHSLYAARRYGYSLNTDHNSEEVYNSVLLLNAAGKPITDFAFSGFSYDQSTDRIIFTRYNGDELQSGLMEPDGTVSVPGAVHPQRGGLLLAGHGREAGKRPVLRLRLPLSRRMGRRDASGRRALRLHRRPGKHPAHAV